MRPLTAMTIGGSDSSAGAGIQADLKSFTALGIHGTTVLTSITVQNTQTVKKIIPTPLKNIKNQIETVMEDIPIKHVKTGLLYQPSIAKIVSNATKKYNWKLIIDPVLTATSGDALASTNLTKEIKKALLPHSTIITPNIPEAEALTESSISTVNDMRQAAKTIHQMGTENVIVKGGHLQDEQAVDILYDGKTFTELSLPRIPYKKAHGSGCTFSALLTGYLAKGCPIQSTFTQSKYALWNMINNGYHVGKGSDVLQITAQTIKDAPQQFPSSAHITTWLHLSEFLNKIIEKLPVSFTPEVGCNIGYAIPEAKTIQDICALNGRIVRSASRIQRCGSLRFGTSKHIASIILAMMKTYPDHRCAMNIKYNIENLSLIKKTPYSFSSFNRTNEPEDVSSTMDWGTQTAIKKAETCPDFIYDTGGIGKEPMIRIIGTNPKNVYEKLSMIISLQKQG
ncbi:MAG: bifunctional hydroxymethylpyrimidine kinase/phosphomethylpyrimidine kinase [Candidatus Thermoplasmatota archaeon]|nr:bifunctional hydroxymethylpyrimidine kinase/phosphomethylpyrimidine kinase [Candidatus Thermoplasmatota archaeon]